MKFSLVGPYDRRFKEELDAISPDLSSDLGRAVELSDAVADRLIAMILGFGCRAQNARNLALGRNAAAELPRRWLLDRIERIAEQTLDLDNDYWEYLRLLELSEPLDRDLLSRLISRGLTSKNPEIVEAANDFLPHEGA